MTLSAAEPLSNLRDLAEFECGKFALDDWSGHLRALTSATISRALW